MQLFDELIDCRTLSGCGFEARIHRLCEGGRDAPVRANGIGPSLELLVSPLGLEGSPTGGGLEEHGADAPDVGGLAEDAAADLLWSHVLARAHAPSPPPWRPCDAEIDHFGQPAIRDYVGGL